MPAFELSVVELALLQEEVHDENTVVVKFLLGYMKDNAELFVPSDIRSHSLFDTYMKTERDMVNALCIHLGVSTEKCKEKYVVAIRYMNAMAAIKLNGYVKL